MNEQITINASKLNYVGEIFRKQANKFRLAECPVNVAVLGTYFWFLERSGCSGFLGLLKPFLCSTYVFLLCYLTICSCRNVKTNVSIMVLILTGNVGPL